MTRIEALADYANAYRDYQVSKGSTFNIEVSTTFATQDMMNMSKHWGDEDAVSVILDEASLLREAA